MSIHSQRYVRKVQVSSLASHLCLKNIWGHPSPSVFSWLCCWALVVSSPCETEGKSSQFSCRNVFSSHSDCLTTCQSSEMNAMNTVTPPQSSQASWAQPAWIRTKDKSKQPTEPLTLNSLPPLLLHLHRRQDLQHPSPLPSGLLWWLPLPLQCVSPIHGWEL